MAKNKTTNIEREWDRPKGIRIVDMCIYIDDNFSELMEHPNPSMENTMVKYLYWIFDALAKKNHYFPRYEDYHEFAIFAAGQAYCILQKKYKNQGKVARNGRVQEPIKSILNYINTVLYAYKVQFQQEMYDWRTTDESIRDKDELADNLREEVRQQYMKDLKEEMQQYLNDDFRNVVIKYLKDTSPYKDDDAMMEKIYISCLLTFISDITLTPKDEKKLNRSASSNKNRKFLEVFTQNSNNVVLWHLPEHMSGYIRFLVTTIKKIVSSQIINWKNPVDLSDSAVDTILQTAFITFTNTENEGK